MYDFKFTFIQEGVQFIIENDGLGYGRKASSESVGGYNVVEIDGDDAIFTFDGGSFNFSIDESGTYPQLTLSDNSFMGYYAGSQVYDIVYQTEEVMALRVNNTVESQDWVFVYILEELNIPATFFINSGYLDNKAYSWVDALNYINDPANRRIIPQNLIQYSSVLRRTTDPFEYNKGRECIESYFNQLPQNKKRYLTTEELFSIQNPLFSIGLHGYEHQRASMMTEAWNRENIRKDIEVLARHPNYVPVYAIPFGRPYDWNNDIIRIALENNLDIMLHDGGYNLHKEVVYNRIAADGLNFELSLNIFQ